ncbi:MAG: hypothetical protein WBL80_03445 [Erysipelotrichaceae bacterium]
MQPKLKSTLLTGALFVFLLLIVLAMLMVFVSGPIEKERRDRVEALKRVETVYAIAHPIYLNGSDYDRICIMGEGVYQGAKVYFAADTVGTVLDRIAMNKVNVTTALASAAKTMTFTKPSLRIAYFKGKFVIAVVERRRETLLDIENYSVILTVETGT